MKMVTSNFQSMQLSYLPISNYPLISLSHASSSVDTKKHYVIDVMNSPVIEIWCSNLTGESKKSDRIYYIKDALLKEPLPTVRKSPEFLQMADDFFKWFRKQFKNAKLPGFEHDIVSASCANRVSSGGKLVKN